MWFVHDALLEATLLCVMPLHAVRNYMWRIDSRTRDFRWLTCIYKSAGCSFAELLGFVGQCHFNYAWDVTGWGLHSDGVRRNQLQRRNSTRWAFNEDFRFLLTAPQRREAPTSTHCRKRSALFNEVPIVLSDSPKCLFDIISRLPKKENIVCPPDSHFGPEVFLRSVAEQSFQVLKTSGALVEMEISLPYKRLNVWVSLQKVF